MKHSGTDTMDVAVRLQSFLLAGFIMVASVFPASEADAQHVRLMQPVASPLPTVSMAEGSVLSSRQAGDLPELAFFEERWCEEIEDMCPLTRYDFGTIATGSSGPYLVALLINQSDSVTATNINIQSDAGFPLIHDAIGLNDCAFVEELPPGGGCRLRVKFAPMESGPVKGMLTATSAEGAETSLPLEGIGGNDRVLYGQFHDWETMSFFFSMRNVMHPNSPQQNSELADDFLVEDPNGWVITQVGLELPTFSFEPHADSFDVLIMSDDGGVPGETPVCSALDSEVFFWESPRDENRLVLTLSSPCELSQGHYWLRVHLHTSDPDFYGWGFQYLRGSEDEPPGEPSIHLNPPVWRNTGNWGGHGCTTWTALYPPTCGLEDALPSILAYGAIFWLIGEPGTVSNEGGPNELAQGLTHPSPNPVRETTSFTLSVDRGQQVTVEVFDIMGRRVQALYEGSLTAGAVENLGLDVSRLPSGVYVIRALGEDFVDTRRVTVVH